MIDTRTWPQLRDERMAKDGFLIEQWSEDADVSGCFAHVDVHCPRWEDAIYLGAVFGLLVVVAAALVR